MTASVTKDIDHQIRTAIDHLRKGLKVRMCIDEAAKLYHALDLAEVTDCCLALRDQVDGAQAGSGLTSFQIHILAEAAFDEAVRANANLA